MNGRQETQLRYRVSVLRLGHRLVRDERMSTHIGLVSRAFGARELVLAGSDDHTVESITRLSKRWGGCFDVKYQRNWRAFVKSWNGMIIHLTMYGEVLDDALPKIRTAAEKTDHQILVVVGAEKVPKEMYNLATYNVSVGTQPHSEVAALAVFLDRLFMGEELYSTFVKANIRIKPSSKGKKVEISDEN